MKKMQKSLLLKICKNMESAKKEDGSALSYVWYFFAIMFTVIVFTFFTFQLDTYVLKDMLDNGLHIVENAIIASSDDDAALNDLKREMNRMKIVSESTAGESWDTQELNQVNFIGKEFAEIVIDYFNLSENTHPSSGTLAKMCGKDADVLITELVIYEPIYKLTITKPAGGVIVVDPTKPFVTPSWVFDINYEIEGWAVYTFVYNGNVYDEIDTSAEMNSRKYYTTNPPALPNGDARLGATIEATMSVSFKGLKNIFSQISNPVDPATIDSYEELNNASQPIFASTPTQEVYHVSVSKAMDIVIADDDDRKVH